MIREHTDQWGHTSQPPLPEIIPLSLAQERLWVLDHLEPGNPAYIVSEAVRLAGPLDTTALRRGLAAVVDRHAVLRTSVIVIDGQPMQQIAPVRLADEAVAMPVFDLGNLPESEQMAQVQELASTEARHRFDLAQGPLLRVRLLRLGAEVHVLLLVLHQVIADQPSLSILFQELATLYADFAGGRSPAAPEPPVQYAEIAARQRDETRERAMLQQLAYWKEQLAGAARVLEMPTDRPRPVVQTFGAARLRLALPPALAAALRELSRREGVSLSTTLLAAFQTLLYRYSGQEDILVGTPVANRRHVETVGMIGPLTNTLVLRGRPTGTQRFREFLARVHETIEAAHAHSDVPFAKLVEALQPERDLGRHPLFQVLFALHEAPAASARLAELAFSRLEIAPEATLTELSLMLVDDNPALHGWLVYNADLFDAATIERLAGHFQTLLESIAANASQTLAELAILSHAERRMVLVEWNRTEAPYPDGACIHERFEAQAALTPHAVAVIGEEQHLSYHELNTRANQLAHHLRQLGVGPETRVAICVERTPEMIVGLLGILKAGAAYVPLDPAYPHERLAFMLEDAQPKVLLTALEAGTGLAQRRVEANQAPQNALFGSSFAGTVVDLVADWPVIAQASSENPASGATPTSPAYIIYTSGSTGTPKGVVGLHRGALNRFQWMWSTYPFAPDEVCCQKTALSFVDSVWEVFGPLLCGVPLVIIPDEAVTDPSRLVRTLAEQQVSRIVLVPSLLQVILETHPELQRQLPHLKYCISSGETLPIDLCRRFHEQIPHCVLLNLYGSSEVAADATWYDTRQIGSLQSVPIGRPIANTQIYILDRCLQPVPVGVPGELYVGGANLARGYFSRPELTAERFLEFGDEQSRIQNPKPTIYKTGDLARYRPDGTIEYLGRLDHQVKIRGVRIELGEIESVLRRHPAVRDAVVVARADTPGAMRLVAYVVMGDEDQVLGDRKPELEEHSHRSDTRHPTPNTRSLRAWLRERLPEHTLPASVVVLETLPLTPNGKVDRRALPPPDQARPELTTSYAAPSTAVEELLAAIWADVLGLERVGIHDNFFELGGYSLKAVQVMSRVREVCEVELPPLRTLFEAPTVADLARAISRRQIAQTDPAALDQLLAEITQLSQDELEATLWSERRVIR